MCYAMTDILHDILASYGGSLCCHEFEIVNPWRSVSQQARLFRCASVFGLWCHFVLQVLADFSRLYGTHLMLHNVTMRMVIWSNSHREPFCSACRLETLQLYQNYYAHGDSIQVPSLEDICLLRSDERMEKLTKLIISCSRMINIGENLPAPNTFAWLFAWSLICENVWALYTIEDIGCMSSQDALQDKVTSGVNSSWNDIN